MKKTNLLALCLFTILIFSCAVTKNDRSEIRTSQYFAKISAEKDIAKLNFFFTQMPKGGDIHHHYSGAIYAETFLDWACAENYFIDLKSFKLSKVKSKNTISIEQLKQKPILYRQVIATWSDLNYENYFADNLAPDLKFFSTFGYFGPISKDFISGLNQIKQRAIEENVQYIETMLFSPKINFNSKEFNFHNVNFNFSYEDTLNLYSNFREIANTISSSKYFKSEIQKYINLVNTIHRNIDDSLFTMRFQTYSTRNKEPIKVFTSLFSSFYVAANSSFIVGVNIVGPENGLVALKDYKLHMFMFRFLKKLFPNVKTAMHAGELRMGLVKPEDLKFHVHDAVFVANANRIGHGVDIPYENSARNIFSKMRNDSIAVEINLTSNEFILGVKNNHHPIKLYSDAKVPIVISTDDAGVSRNNLTTEYAKLASRYHFTYKEIKNFVYNSIKFSFLSKKEKRILINKLNKKFKQFERKISEFILVK